MKRIAFLFLSLFFIITVGFADNDKPISADSLPAQARQFLEQYFSGVKISFAKEETEFLGKSYEVMLANGNRVEFDKDGNWTDVDCKYAEIPLGIVPQPIHDYVNTHYKDAKIIEIDRDRHDYEIKLNNKLELTFDFNYKLIDID